jgi:F420H(2)-dependent quinone reductase
MVITAWVISLLAILLAPILLLRFRKRWAAAFNLAVTNRITSRFANRLPGFGILTHVGRKSGKVYRTPVNVFRAPDGFLIALTYGRDSEWVKNVLAAGKCQLDAPRAVSTFRTHHRA